MKWAQVLGGGFSVGIEGNLTIHARRGHPELGYGAK
jgi:hypothetical protein